MFCKNCGKESGSTKKFCTNCGQPFLSNEKGGAETLFPNALTSPNKNMTGIIKKTLGILVVVGLIGWGIYSSLDDDVVEKNNEGIENFDSGNSGQAITQLQDASQNAVSNENKINSLKNLAYVYSSDGKTDLASNSFKEALALTSSDSFDYYLISGEIALLEGKPNSAQIAYSKAYQKEPNNFQINNALTLFYLDIDEVAPQYRDYEKALQHAQRAFQLSDLQIVKQNLGLAYFFNENYSQAINLLLPYVNNEPEASFFVGLAYFNQEDHVNAKFYLRKALNAGMEMPQEFINYLNS